MREERPSKLMFLKASFLGRGRGRAPITTGWSSLRKERVRQMPASPANCPRSWHTAKLPEGTALFRSTCCGQSCMTAASLTFGYGSVFTMKSQFRLSRGPGSYVRACTRARACACVRVCVCLLCCVVDEGITGVVNVHWGGHPCQKTESKMETCTLEMSFVVSRGTLTARAGCTAPFVSCLFGRMGLTRVPTFHYMLNAPLS